MNKQIRLSNLEDELSHVQTKKKEFLEQIERIVPWNEWTAMIKPCYYNFLSAPIQLSLFE